MRPARDKGDGFRWERLEVGFLWEWLPAAMIAAAGLRKRLRRPCDAAPARSYGYGQSGSAVTTPSSGRMKLSWKLRISMVWLLPLPLVKPNKKRLRSA